ncbi:MAG: hypothetical protein V3S40_11010, partial [Kiloniellales bacterium]
ALMRSPCQIGAWYVDGNEQRTRDSMADANKPAFAEIAEADATGRTRQIYDDFKASIGLPMVNLVYRHMATTPGCLEWAWALLRPHFVGGALAREAERLVAGLDLGERWSIARHELRDAGVDAAAETTIARTLEAYNRANPMNLIALAVLTRELAHPTPDGGEAPPETGPTPPRPTSVLPPMGDVSALPNEIQMVLSVLSTQAGVGGTAVVPTLYRHLTEWPGYLAIAVSAGARLVDDGSLDREAPALQEEAHRAANRIPRYATVLPAPTASQRDNLLGLIALFPALIARMIVIGVQLRRSMPG